MATRLTGSITVASKHLPLRIRAVAALGLVLALSGCSPSGPPLIEVRGTVTYQGQPVKQGTITFVPVAVANGARPAIAKIEPTGDYHLSAFPGRDGALPGEYRVAVLSYTGSTLERTAVYLVPEKFSEVTTSGLQASVPSDTPGPLVLNFELKN